VASEQICGIYAARVAEVTRPSRPWIRMILLLCVCVMGLETATRLVRDLSVGRSRSRGIAASSA